MGTNRNVAVVAASVLSFAATCAGAQSLESVGVRAAGMAGAFVAVASDSSAIWWNPGALPAGSFVDASIGHMTASDTGEGSEASARATTLAFALPMAGLHLARYDVAGAAPARGHIGAARASVTQAGVTLVQSVVSGLHIGGTLKYLHATSSAELRIGSAFGAVNRARALDLETGHGAWDADLGVVAVHRAWRVGLVARQLGAPTFDAGGTSIRLGRQARVGLAYDAAASKGPAVVVSADADLTSTSGPDGSRRDVAVGVERWIREGRIGVRGGFRASTEGEARPVGALGASVLVKSGMFLEISGASGARGGRASWGASARVAF